MKLKDSRSIRWIVGLLTAAAPLLLATGAQAYAVAPGWIASDYAVDFPSAPSGIGPAGLVFDREANLLVADHAAAGGALYRIPPGGGSASGQVIRDGYGRTGGLAFDKQGRLYMGRTSEHDVVEISPESGMVKRTLAVGLPCPVGLATDPLSGDLFVSNVGCSGGSIMRVDPRSGSASPYTPTRDGDGLTFAPDGTLYAASNDEVLRISGTDSSSPGDVTVIASVPGADGIAYSPATGSSDPFLVVNSRNGVVDRVDFDGTATMLLSGGSRGDLATVGPDRCVYLTQTDRIIKLGPAVGLCSFSPLIPPGRQDVLGTRVARRVIDVAVVARAPKRLRRGASFRVRLTGANRSTRAAHALTLTDKLPKGVRLVRTRASKGVKCRRRRSTVTCRKASLAPHASFKVALRVRPVRRRSVYVNVARIKSADLDPAPGNNRAYTRTRRRATRA